MKMYYSDSAIPTQTTRSIFLAGPSPRDNDTLDWRIEAVEILKELGFKGEVFVPIPEGKFGGGHDDASWTYMNQIEWECQHRAIADYVVFWVPRDIKGGMPGFTTNIEFGEDLGTGKVLYGRPEGAEKCRYLDERYIKTGGAVHDDLRALLSSAITKLGHGALRTKGEIFIPLFIWQSPEFQKWYTNLKAAGNKLMRAEVLSHMRIPNGMLFSYTLKVEVWVEAEKRIKHNEAVFFRKNISSVLAYYEGEKSEDFKTMVVLVKEFRSPVNNKEGYVYELPSGSYTSGVSQISGVQNAQQELFEETGLNISNLGRFELVSQRQVAATLCAYTNELYKIRLTRPEFQFLEDKAASGASQGMEKDTERTYVHVLPLNKLYDKPVDYSTLGMIYEAIHKD